MVGHRLRRLARLTQGAALVGFGLATEVGCTKEPVTNAPPPHDPPHMNATATPPPVADAATLDVATATDAAVPAADAAAPKAAPLASAVIGGAARDASAPRSKPTSHPVMPTNGPPDRGMDINGPGP